MLRSGRTSVCVWHWIAVGTEGRKPSHTLGRSAGETTRLPLGVHDKQFYSVCKHCANNPTPESRHRIGRMIICTSFANNPCDLTRGLNLHSDVAHRMVGHTGARNRVRCAYDYYRSYGLNKTVDATYDPHRNCPETCMMWRKWVIIWVDILQKCLSPQCMARHIWQQIIRAEIHHACSVFPPSIHHKGTRTETPPFTLDHQ